MAHPNAFPDVISGWQIETFAGMGDGFGASMPWYYRTKEDWLSLLTQAGYEAAVWREPLHLQTGQAVSLLLAARPGPQ